MSILTHDRPTTPTAAPDADPPLRLRMADLGGDLVARLDGRTLYLDPTADPGDQLAAVVDAAEYLRTGHAEWAQLERHLHLVAGGRQS